MLVLVDQKMGQVNSHQRDRIVDLWAAASSMVEAAAVAIVEDMVGLVGIAEPGLLADTVAGAAIAAVGNAVVQEVLVDAGTDLRKAAVVAKEVDWHTWSRAAQSSRSLARWEKQGFSHSAGAVVGMPAVEARVV